jgi:hypothetical protein
MNRTTRFLRNENSTAGEIVPLPEGKELGPVKRSYRWPARLCALALLAGLLAVSAACGKKKVSADSAPAAEWFDDLRERVRKGFDDSEQVTELTGVVDRMEATMNELDHVVVEYYAKIGELDRNHDTTREQFQDMIDEFNGRQDAAFETMLEYMTELKQIAGRDGWAKICDMDKTLYESWQREL